MIIGVIVSGRATRPSVLWLAVIGVGILVLAAGLLAGLIRPEPLARRFGGWREIGQGAGEVRPV